MEEALPRPVATKSPAGKVIIGEARGEKMDYQLALLDEMDRLILEVEVTSARIWALEKLLNTRWPLGQRKQPSELKAARLELRRKQFYLKHIMSEQDNLRSKFLEALGL